MRDANCTSSSQLLPKSPVLHGPEEVPSPPGCRDEGHVSLGHSQDGHPGGGCHSLMIPTLGGGTWSPSSHVDGIALEPTSKRAKTPSIQHKALDKPRGKHTREGEGVLAMAGEGQLQSPQ